MIAIQVEKEKDKLVAHAREQQPSESCAMLLGKKVGDNVEVRTPAGKTTYTVISVK